MPGVVAAVGLGDEENPTGRPALGRHALYSIIAGSMWSSGHTLRVRDCMASLEAARTGCKDCRTLAPPCTAAAGLHASDLPWHLLLSERIEQEHPRPSLNFVQAPAVEHAERDPSSDDSDPWCPIMTLAWQTVRNTDKTNVKMQTVRGLRTAASLSMGRRAGNDDSSSLDSGLQVK